MAGSRTMTASATTASAVAAQATYGAVKVEWGGSTGTVWYSDATRTVGGVSMQGRVTSWGPAASRLNSGGEFSFTLSDDDSAIRDAITADGLVGHTVTLYQVWPALASANWTVIWSGITEPNSRWDERDATVRITCLGKDQSMRSEIGLTVNEADFPYADPDAYGRTLPVVYGNKYGVEPVWVKGGGPVTKTVSVLEYATWTGSSWDYITEQTFRVERADDFPASSAVSPIDLWVGRELLRGYFDATDTNLFHVTNRNLAFKTGSCTFDDWSYVRLNLDATEPTGYWEGFSIMFRIANWVSGAWQYVGPYQYRTILKYDKVNGSSEAFISMPFSNGQANNCWVKGEADLVSGYLPWWPMPHEDATLWYAIASHRQRHARGATVRYSPAGDRKCVFIVSDRAASAVTRVYVETSEGSQMLGSGTYEVNLNDSQFSAQLGGNCATVSFRLPPEAIRWRVSVKAAPPPGFYGSFIGPAYDKIYTVSGRIMASVKGPEEDGSLMEHPARVLRHLALRAGLAAGDVDETSVTAAVTARPGWRCAFALERSSGRPGDVLAQLAAQFECAVDWTQGKLRLVALRNDIDAAALARTITTGRLLDTWTEDRAGIQEVVSQLRGEYEDHEGVTRVTVRRDATSAALHGVREDGIDCWAYIHKNPTRAAVDWWLYRRRYGLRAVRQVGPLPWLDLLPGDVVLLAGERGWVDEVRFAPGDAQAKTLDSVELAVTVPPAEWYASWSYGGPTYEDPDDPASDDLITDTPDWFHPGYPNDWNEYPESASPGASLSPVSRSPGSISPHVSASAACPSPACPSPACPSPACPSVSPACPSPACPSPACPSPACPSPACPSISPACPSGPSPACPSPSASPACPSPACPSPACPSPSASPACPSPACPSASPSAACPSPSESVVCSDTYSVETSNFSWPDRNCFGDGTKCLFDNGPFNLTGSGAKPDGTWSGTGYGGETSAEATLYYDADDGWCVRFCFDTSQGDCGAGGSTMCYAKFKSGDTGDCPPEGNYTYVEGTCADSGNQVLVSIV